MRNRHRLVRESGRAALVAFLFVALPAASCNNSDFIGGLGDGGRADGKPGTGGVTGTGGGSGAGGMAGTGGRAGTGGNAGVGGGAGSGGVAGTGGRVGTGGSGGSSGVAGTGGRVGTGGNTGVGGISGSGGAGGAADAALDAHECPPITDLYCTYVLDAYGCMVCAPGGTGGSGSGGATGNGGAGGAKTDDAGQPDVQVSSDASALATLCTSTGGQISSGLCCTSAADFPDSCMTGACGCSPTSSHTVATCTCPNGSCFSTKTGCGGTDAAQDGPVVCGSTTCAAGEYCCNPPCSMCAPIGYGCVQGCATDAAQDVDGNGCTAQPAGDSVSCGGSKPPHFYTCILTMLAAPCAIVSIGDVTNTFCCP